MNIEKISVQKVFPIGPYMNVKLGLEASVDKDEDVKVAITAAEELLNDWFNNSYPNVGEPVVYTQGEPQGDIFSGPIPKQKQVARNSVLRQPDKDIRVRYAKAVASKDESEVNKLESMYDFKTV